MDYSSILIYKINTQSIKYQRHLKRKFCLVSDYDKYLLPNLYFVLSFQS